MTWWQWIFLILGGLVFGLFLFLKLVDVFFGKAPTNLGVVNGQLTPMKRHSNWGVCSYESFALQHLDPIPYRLEMAEAVPLMVSVLQSLKQYPRITLQAASPPYIRARDISWFWRWKDDIEFYFQESTHLIHFRSSPRYGTTDGGYNKNRMTVILMEYQRRETEAIGSSTP